MVFTEIILVHDALSKEKAYWLAKIDNLQQ